MNDTITARLQHHVGQFRLSLDVELPGRGITVVFGPSGSGKTTFLRCLAGLQKAQEGHVSIKGQIWQDSELNVFVTTHRRNLGYVFQEANLFPHLSVLDNLRFGLVRLRRPSATVHLQDAIDRLGIGHLLERMPGGLSGGERQRVAIARALALKPDILLLDEPLASLDARRKQEIMPYLIQLHRELALPMVYVTHSEQEVAQLADHMLLMNDGRVVAAGPLTETLSRTDLSLAQDKQAFTVWQGVVAGVENRYRLMHVDFDGTEVLVPSAGIPLGTTLRLQIFARDVSIALAKPDATSILNVLPAVVTGITDDHGGHAVIRLQIGQQRLLAHITQKSQDLLQLRTGLPVFAQIKGTSIFV